MTEYAIVKLNNRVWELEKENEQLKSKNRGLQSELQIFKEDVTHSNLQINKLTDENEQLKSRIKDYDVALKKLQDLTDKKLKENEQLKQAYNDAKGDAEKKEQILKDILKNNLLI